MTPDAVPTDSMLVKAILQVPRYEEHFPVSLDMSYTFHKFG